MGGIFSLEKDSDRGVDVAPASAAAGASDEPVGTSLTEPAVPARKNSVSSFSSVTDSTRDSLSEGIGAAKVAQS